MIKLSYKLPIALYAISIAIGVVFLPYIKSSQSPDPPPERTAMLGIALVAFNAASGIVAFRKLQRPL